MEAASPGIINLPERFWKSHGRCCNAVPFRPQQWPSEEAVEEEAVEEGVDEIQAAWEVVEPRPMPSPTIAPHLALDASMEVVEPQPMVAQDGIDFVMVGTESQLN